MLTGRGTPNRSLLCVAIHDFMVFVLLARREGLTEVPWSRMSVKLLQYATRSINSATSGSHDSPACQPSQHTHRLFRSCQCSRRRR